MLTVALHPSLSRVVEEAVSGQGETIVIRDVHFQFDKATRTGVKKGARQGVSPTRLKTGHPRSASTDRHRSTDSVGSDAYNQKLSDRRAHSVVKYLVESGIPQGSFVSVTGAGESQPVADNKPADGRAQSRRTDINITRSSSCIRGLCSRGCGSLLLCNRYGPVTQELSQ